MRASASQDSLFDFGPQQLIEDLQGGVFYRPGVIGADFAARELKQKEDGPARQALRRHRLEGRCDWPASDMLSRMSRNPVLTLEPPHAHLLM